MATKILRLQRNGNATMVTVPREYLARLQWRCGQNVAVQLMSDNSLWIRVPNERDFAPDVPGAVARLANAAGSQ